VLPVGFSPSPFVEDGTSGVLPVLIVPSEPGIEAV
jgi:hypothetical protein